MGLIPCTHLAARRTKAVPSMTLKGLLSFHVVAFFVVTAKYETLADSLATAKLTQREFHIWFKQSLFLI